jgi:hypothetical protein
VKFELPKRLHPVVSKLNLKFLRRRVAEWSAAYHEAVVRASVGAFLQLGREGSNSGEGRQCQGESSEGKHGREHREESEESKGKVKNEVDLDEGMYWAVSFVVSTAMVV